MEEKHGRGGIAAFKMLDTFASVGVQFFDITHTNIEGEKRGFRAKQTLAETQRSMPFLLDSAPRRQNNVIVRPHRPPAVLLVQLDDLNAAALECVTAVAFLILNTSPGNFQAWVAVDNPNGATDADFSRRLRKGAGADPTASGATRVAGTMNFKAKYAPEFPVVAITAAEPGRIVTREEIEARGLVSPPEPFKAAPQRSEGRRVGKWPSYQYCLERAPKSHGEDKPDTSRADFTWCMTAIDWGHDTEDTASRLMIESTKAQENGERYAIDTARNAAAAVLRRQNSKGPTP